jgi:hypothetical protein
VPPSPPLFIVAYSRMKLDDEREVEETKKFGNGMKPPIYALC